MRGFEPNVWGVFAAKDCVALGGERVADELGVFEIEADECFGLLLACFGIDRGRAALNDIGSAVEFCCLTA